MADCKRATEQDVMGRSAVDAKGIEIQSRPSVGPPHGARDPAQGPLPRRWVPAGPEMPRERGEVTLPRRRINEGQFHQESEKAAS